MRERDRSVNIHPPIEARAPHRTGKIAQPIGRKQRRFLEWRTKKCAGQMRHVMFDSMELCRQACRIRIKRRGQCFTDAGKFRQHLDSFSRKRRHAQRVKEFSSQPRVWIARHRHVVHILRRDSRRLQAIANRRRWKSRRVFHAIEALFFHRGDQLSVAQNRSRSISMVRIDAKNIHLPDFQCSAGAERIRDQACPLNLSCFLTHSFNTKSAHGRDHEVCPARNEFHTALTPSSFSSALSESGTDAKLSSTRAFKGPRSHCSHGSVKVRFFCAVISAGNNFPSASTSSAFWTPLLRRASSGSAVTNSTSGVSSSGTRTSSERAMLTASVSRSSVLAIYVRSSSQLTAATGSMCRASSAASCSQPSQVGSSV